MYLIAASVVRDVLQECDVARQQARISDIVGNDIQCRKQDVMVDGQREFGVVEDLRRLVDDQMPIGSAMCQYR